MKLITTLILSTLLCSTFEAQALDTYDTLKQEDSGLSVADYDQLRAASNLPFNLKAIWLTKTAAACAESADVLYTVEQSVDTYAAKCRFYITAKFQVLDDTFKKRAVQILQAGMKSNHVDAVWNRITNLVQVMKSADAVSIR